LLNDNFTQRVLSVHANFERCNAILTCEQFSVFQIFTLNPVAIPAVNSAGISALSKLYVHSQSSWNAMLRHFQITRVASWTFALILCGWISACVGGSRNPRLLSQQWLSNRSTGIIILLIDIVSLSPRGRPLATNSAKALQCAADSLLFKLPPAAAVQSSGPDPNKFLIIRLRLRCPRDELAPAATARRTCRCRALERKRTVQANRYVKQQLDVKYGCACIDAKYRQNTCKYMHIWTVLLFSI
jgi:hypothetical protein